MRARSILGGHWRTPDLTIAPDGKPYLYRWHVIPRNDQANVYFHIQVDSDPERPLHDHPWANTSVILSGGYDEIWNPTPWLAEPDRMWKSMMRRSRVGDVIHRTANEAHRLILPPEFKYTMTLFTTGPKVRPWGFWFPEGWRDASTVTEMENGMSVMTEEARGDANPG
jgi:hypothetical protein